MCPIEQMGPVLSMIFRLEGWRQFPVQTKISSNTGKYNLGLVFPIYNIFISLQTPFKMFTKKIPIKRRFSVAFGWCQMSHPFYVFLTPIIRQSTTSCLVIILNKLLLWVEERAPLLFFFPFHQRPRGSCGRIAAVEKLSTTLPSTSSCARATFFPCLFHASSRLLRVAVGVDLTSRLNYKQLEAVCPHCTTYL